MHGRELRDMDDHWSRPNAIPGLTEPLMRSGDETVRTGRDPFMRRTVKVGPVKDGPQDAEASDTPEMRGTRNV